MTPSVVDMMSALGYSGADIHFLHQYFDVGGLIVLDPTRDNTKQVDTRKRNYVNMNVLVTLGNKNLIDKAIIYGRVGLTYKECTLSEKPLTLYEGTMIDVRTHNGIPDTKVRVTFTYNNVNGKYVNETETKVVVYNDSTCR